MWRYSMHIRLTLIIVLALAVVLLARPVPVRAAACEWTGTNSTDWADADNWDSCDGGTPDSGDTATIPSVTKQPLIGSSTSVTVSGLIIASGASLAVDGSLSLGDLSGAGSLTVNGSLNWSGGTWQGTGDTTIAGGGILTISGAGAKTLNGRTITNNGTANVTSGFNFQNGAVFDNQATFDIQASADVDFGTLGGTPSFNNAGTVRKSAASSKATFLFAFNNTGGTIDVQEGGISLNGGGAHTGGTFTVASGRYLNFYGGGTTHTVSGSYSGSGAGTPQLSGGATLQVDAAGATFNFGGGGFQWSWGTITGGTLTNDGLLKIAGSSYGKYLNASTLTNNGTVNVTDAGTVYFQNGAVFDNQAGATFDIQTDVTLDWDSGSAPSFNNAGTVTKSGGTSITTIDIAFNNTGGTVDVQSGNISLNGGGTHTGGTFTVDSDAALNFTGGTHTVSGSYSGSGAGTPQLTMGALLQVDATGATFNFGGGGFQWSWGTITGGTLTNNGLFKITSGYDKYLDAGTITNNGTANLTDAGTVYFSNGAVFNNQALATFDIQTDVTLDWDSGSAPSFNNSGTVTKSAGSGTATIDVAFNNSGTVNVQSGTLALGDDLTNNSGGLVQIDKGTTLTVDGTLTNNGTLRQTLAVDGSGAVEFLHLTNSGGGTDKYRGVIVDTPSNMGDTTVSIKGNQTCSTDGAWSNTVKRCYEIAPTTLQTASVTFYYLDSEANGNTAPDVYHWNGSNWVLQTFDARYTSGHPWVCASGISSYSPFALSDGQPTAVTLSSFSVQSNAHLGASLVWPWLIGVATLAMGGIVWVKRRSVRLGRLGGDPERHSTALHDSLRR